MSKNTIVIGILTKKYPGFAFMEKGTELCGYNPQNSEYLVIDDGMYQSDTGTWVVHHYRITFTDFNPFEAYKHPGNGGIKISEERVALVESDKLLPMPPRSAVECYAYEPLYNLPPTYKEGAKKVILVRDLFHRDGRPLWKAGTKGVVIPIQRLSLAELFENVRMFYEHYDDWKKNGGYYPCRLDCTYDFFPFYTNKQGKIRPSQYHAHISFADFQYL